MSDSNYTIVYSGIRPTKTHYSRHVPFPWVCADLDFGLPDGGEETGYLVGQDIASGVSFLLFSLDIGERPTETWLGPGWSVLFFLGRGRFLRIDWQTQLLFGIFLCLVYNYLYHHRYPAASRERGICVFPTRHNGRQSALHNTRQGKTIAHSDRCSYPHHVWTETTAKRRGDRERERWRSRWHLAERHRHEWKDEECGAQRNIETGTGWLGREAWKWAVYYFRNGIYRPCNAAHLVLR